MEKILELQPDLIIADEGLPDDSKQKFEAAGIPVLIEMLMEPRLPIAVQNFAWSWVQLTKPPHTSISPNITKPCQHPLGKLDPEPKTHRLL
jgi:hypothetical protein